MVAAAGGGEPTLPNVVARLPFLAMPNARARGVSALVLARIEPEESGEDRALISVESPEGLSRDRIAGAVAKVGLPAFSSAMDQVVAGVHHYLLELPGVIVDVDPRLRALETALGLHRGRVAALGAYAVRPPRRAALIGVQRESDMTALTPRPGIMKIAPYVPGKDSVDGKETIAKLSSNEGALGPQPKAMAAYAKAAAELHRYPDGARASCAPAIGRHYGLDAKRIVCGSGSDELLNLLVRAYCGPGDELLYSQFGFLMYPINALGVGATPVAAPEKDYRADVDAMLARVTNKTRVVCLANPNNPTGSLHHQGRGAPPAGRRCRGTCCW